MVDPTADAVLKQLFSKPVIVTSFVKSLLNNRVSTVTSSKLVSAKSEELAGGDFFLKFDILAEG